MGREEDLVALRVCVVDWNVKPGKYIVDVLLMVFPVYSRIDLVYQDNTILWEFAGRVQKYLEKLRDGIVIM